MPLGFWRSALTDFALSSLQPSPGGNGFLHGKNMGKLGFEAREMRGFYMISPTNHDGCSNHDGLSHENGGFFEYA